MGAAFLVAGSVIIGRREEGTESRDAGSGSNTTSRERFRDQAASSHSGGRSSGSDVGFTDGIELNRKTARRDENEGRLN